MSLIKNIRQNTPSMIFGQVDQNMEVFGSDIKIEFYNNSILVDLQTNNQLKISGKICNDFKGNEKKIFSCYSNQNIIIIKFVTRLNKITMCNTKYKYIGVLYENDDMEDINSPNYKMQLYGIYPIGSYVKDYKKVGTFYSDV